MRKYQIDFQRVQVGQTFCKGGNKWFKRSTRTAHIINPVEYSGVWFYFSNLEKCTVYPQTYKLKKGFKMRTIKSISEGGECFELSGNVALLYVGNKRYKFLIHCYGTTEKFLTHFASGKKLGSLTPLIYENFKSNYTFIKDRELSKLLIEKLINKHGVERVQVAIDSAQAIN